MNNALKLSAALLLYVFIKFGIQSFNVFSAMCILTLAECTIYFVLSFQKGVSHSFKSWKEGALMLLFFLCTSVFCSMSVSLIFPFEQIPYSFYETLAAVIAVPLGEELFFRGTVFGLLKKMSVPAASVISSLIFALSHASIQGFICAFFAGLVLCMIYKRTGNLILPVICHATNNLLAAAVSIPEGLFLPLAAVSFALIALLAGIFYKKGFFKS